MFIIYGTRTTTSTFETGAFHCPRCGPNREYNHRRVKNWFTLYFIPVIPLGTRGHYVECLQCAGTFSPEVLCYTPEGQPAFAPALPEIDLDSPTIETGMNEQIKRLFVLAAVSNGKPTAATMQSLQYCYRHLVNKHLESNTIEYEANLALQARTDLLTFAQKVSHVIEPSLRPKILTGVHLIQSAQRGNRVANTSELRQLGQALQMTDKQLESTLATLSKA
jgi:hypothetical protein